MGLDMITRSHDLTLEWLRNHNLLPTGYICCNTPMQFSKRESKLEMFYMYSDSEYTWFAQHKKILSRILFHYFPNELNAKRVQEALHREAGYDLSYRVIKEGTKA